MKQPSYGPFGWPVKPSPPFVPGHEGVGRVQPLKARIVFDLGTGR